MSDDYNLQQRWNLVMLIWPCYKCITHTVKPPLNNLKHSTDIEHHVFTFVRWKLSLVGIMLYEEFHYEWIWFKENRE